MAIESTQQKLYRSNKDKIICGICGGLGEYFDVDTVIFRSLFVVLTFVNGIGLLLYLILWILVPLRGEEAFSVNGKSAHIHGLASDSSKSEYSNVFATASEGKKKKSTGKIVFAFVVLVVGIVALFSNLFSTDLFRFEIMWPIFLVFIGLYLIFKD